MNQEKKVLFEVALDNGEKVQVTYYPDFMNHLEFRGNISETGYRSEFPFPHDGPLSSSEVTECARELAQKLYNENPAKHGIQRVLL